MLNFIMFKLRIKVGEPVTEPLQPNEVKLPPFNTKIKECLNLFRTEILSLKPFSDKGIVLLMLTFTVIGILMSRISLELKSDGPNYFVYLRSVFFDFDIDFRNEYFSFDKSFWDTYRPKFTETGYYTNVFSVGPAILWSPFYAVAHVFVLLSNLKGQLYTPNGFSSPYIYAVNLASLFYSFLGTALTYKICTRYFSRSNAFISAVTVFLSSFVLYYVVFQPHMSHSVSFFSVTLFVWYWNRTRTGRNSLQWCLLGLLAGLMMLVRWQNGIFMIFPAFESLSNYYSSAVKREVPLLLGLLKHNLLFLLCALIGFFPQMLTWKIIYGGYLTIPQGIGFLRWSTPFIPEILFSSRHGLFSWSPVVYLAAIGWFRFSKGDRLLFYAGSTAFLLMLYVNSIVLDWWAGWSFGMRRFDGFILMFAIGTASWFDLVQKAKPKLALVLMCIALVFFTGFNVNLMNYLNTIFRAGDPISFKDVLNLGENSFYEVTGYPFSYPANAIFALKYGEPVWRYDTLVGAYIDDPPFRGKTIEMKEPHPFLKSGWSEPRGYNGVYWRVMDRHASIYAPLLSPVDMSMVVHAKAITSPDNHLSIYLNGTKIGSFRLQPQWYFYTVKLPKNMLNPRINEIKFVNPEGESISVKSISFYGLESIHSWK